MDEIKQDIKHIKETQEELVKCQIRMESDVAHHIKRTDTLQKMTEPMFKAYIGAKWSVGAIIALGAILASIGKIKGLF